MNEINACIASEIAPYLADRLNASLYFTSKDGLDGKYNQYVHLLGTFSRDRSWDRGEILLNFHQKSWMGDNKPDHTSVSWPFTNRSAFEKILWNRICESCHGDSMRFAVVFWKGKENPPLEFKHNWYIDCNAELVESLRGKIEKSAFILPIYYDEDEKEVEIINDITKQVVSIVYQCVGEVCDDVGNDASSEADSG